MKKDFLITLYQRPQTVFTLAELSMIFPELPYKNLKSKVSYFIRTGKLKRVRKGIYVKKNFDFWEMANKIYTPSYISFETILAKKGIVFQKYQTIFVASYLTRRLKVAGQKIFYRKLKNKVLLNRKGVDQKKACFVAQKERAFLDAVFLYKDYHFDNLKPLNWQKINEFAEIYESQALLKRVKDYYQIYNENHV